MPSPRAPFDGLRRAAAFGVASCVLLAARAGHADASLRVVSLNIWGLPIVSDAREARMRALGPALVALQPQLVALQEVWAEEDAVLLGAALADAGLKYQERRTSAHLFGNHNAGLLVASAYPIEEVRFTEFELGRYAHTPWHLEWLSTKGALAARVKTALGSLEFVDTHLQASYRTGHYVPTRLAQALEVATLLGRTEAVVLAGDFNSPPDELPFRALLAASALRATSAVSGSGTIGDARDADEMKDLDAVLVRGSSSVDVEVVRSRRIFAAPVALDDGSQRPLSDHEGLLVDLRLTPPSPRAVSGVAQPPRWQSVAPDIDAMFAEEFARTSGQRLRAFVALIAASTAVGFALLRRARPGPRRGLLLMLALVMPFAFWCGFFALAYAPAQLSGVARARALAAARAP